MTESSSFKREELEGFGYRWRQASGLERRMAVVLVHGWTGDALTTWTARPAFWRRWLAPFKKPPQEVALVDLVARHHPGRYDFYSLRHGAGVSWIEIKEVADLLLGLLKTHVPSCQPVALVAHSLGGLACRLALLKLLRRPPSERSHEIAGILLYGTPNHGSQVARLARRFSRSARQMTPLHEFLSELNRDWAERVINGGRHELEPNERIELVCWNLVGIDDRVVPLGSAAGLAHLGAVRLLPKDHRNLPKARSPRDASYLSLIEFLETAEQEVRNRPRLASCARLLGEQRRHLLTKDWVDSEEEHIELNTSEDRKRLECRVRQLRRGGYAKKSFRFLAQVEGLEGPPGRIDYRCLVGRGLLSDAEASRLTSDIDSPESCLQIENLYVVQGGRRFDYKLVPGVERGIGWVVWTWCAPEELREGELYEALEFVHRSTIDRRAGWYYYEAPRTVVRQLVVDLCAPFRLNCQQRLRRGAKCTETPREGEGRISQVVAEGPIAAGSSVYWFFVDPEMRSSPVLD
jgi:pimeloyl-ACP methyl ester carboxylesterase